MIDIPLVVLASEIGFMLEEAIDNKDWAMVCEVFYKITGEEKKVEEDKVEIVDANSYSRQFHDMKSEILSALREELGQEKKTQPKKPSPKKDVKPKQSDDFSVKNNKPSRKVTDRPSTNKFEQMQDLTAEAEQENGFDKINDNVKPVERSRKTYSPKKVACTECGGINEVNPIFARETYTCDKCMKKRIR